MLTSVALSALVSLVAVNVVHADPSPLEPAPGNVYTEGGNCAVTWGKDTTGNWTEMYIELMSGPNDPMVHLTTVSIVDATSTTSFTYECPTVSLHAPVYFYQFSTPASQNVTWTGRFTITDSTGTSSAAPNSTTADGETYNWGIGALTNASQFTAGPSYLSTETTVPIASTTSSTSAVTTSVDATTTGTSSSDDAQSTKISNANTKSSGALKSVVGKTVVSMSVVAGAFAVLL